MELFDMNLIEYTQYDGFGLAELVRKKQITPEELSQLFIQAVAKVNPQINSVFGSRHKGKQHLALRGVGATLWAGGQTRSFLNPGLMFFRSMVCLSHEPYYFSTRWNTNGLNIPLFHHSNRTTLSLDSEALEGRLSTGCERSELSSCL